MDVIADGARLGDRFVAPVGAPPGWLPADELFGRALPAALVAVGERRGTTSAAVAGVLLFEQYALRLVAPVLAARHLYGTVLDARPSAVRVELLDGAVRRLAYACAPAPGEFRAAELAAALDPAADAVHRQTRAGMRILRGAVANAVASTYLHLSWPDDHRARYVDAARAVLHDVGLAELVNLDTVDCGGEPWMYTDRNTCCLAFRTTVNQAREQRYCATCPILPRATTRGMFAAATASYAERHPRTGTPCTG